MAHSGRITLLDIEFGGVKWTDYVHGPPDAPDWALEVDVRELRLDVAVLRKRAVLDTESPHALEGSWRCVLLGKHNKGKRGNETALYVLLIRPVIRGSLSSHSGQS